MTIDTTRLRALAEKATPGPWDGEYKYGIMTADPRLVPSAVVLPEVTYSEAAELAYRDRHPGCTWAEATQEVIPMIAIVSSQYSAWFWEPVKVKQRAAGIEV